MKKIGLRTILIVSMVFVFGVSFVVFIIADRNSLVESGQEALLEEARIFADEMDAVWQFMEYAEKRFDDDTEEFYQQSNLYCAFVGKSVGAIFSADNDYKIRYTNVEPRNIIDAPDGYELEALAVFEADRTRTEFYGISEYDGEEVFRYVRALEVTDSCLTCHGDPVGEIDVTGHAKEGWTLDSIGGAISIIIPLDMYNATLKKNIANDAFFVTIATLAAYSIIFLVVFFFVFRPLDKIKKSFELMSGGDLAITIDEEYEAKEIRELVAGFNDMAGKLNTLYANLEEEVKDRTHDLIQANETLEHLNNLLVREVQYKSDFLSMVSHELRTPLTSILVFTQLLRAEAKEQHDEKEERSWFEIEKNCHILLGMINNILDIARSDAGNENVVCDFMDLGDLATSVKAITIPLAKSTGVEFSACVDSDVPLVKGDFEKTLRMLENLANNAIKFTPKGGKVQLSIEYDKDEDAVYIKTADTGIGIAENDRERIFDRFVQVDVGITRDFRGSGLGLSLVKGYSELQGYTVSVESTLGKGSTFVVRIPSEAIVHFEEEDVDR
ncbi:MAG: DUF3365 domain-containing protein [Actinobacteria bacterium]|nr:DUF3365 domain-containing protein [Actinomycetota bacterium]